MNERRDIIVSDTLTGIGKGEVAGYLCHAYCHKGFCEFTYSNNVYRLEMGECLIIRRGDLVEQVNESEDFLADVVYVTPEFIEVSTPHSNYGMKGSLALFLLIAAFASRSNVSEAEAYRYLSQYGALALCDKHYGIMHTLSLEENIQTLQAYCQRKGGTL